MQQEEVGSQEGLAFAVCSEKGIEGGCGCFGNDPLEREKLKGREKRGTFRSDVLEKGERWDPDHVGQGPFLPGNRGGRTEDWGHWKGREGDGKPGVRPFPGQAGGW